LPLLRLLALLRTFDASSNQLTGPIPSLTGDSSLETFMVYDNQLTGPMPPLAHQGLDALFWFVAFENELTGSIPSLEGLSRLN
jgi:hypothetical protein